MHCYRAFCHDRSSRFAYLPKSRSPMTMLIVGIIIGQLVLGFYIIMANAGADE